jgi:uncharacterized Zn finger protein
VSAERGVGDTRGRIGRARRGPPRDRVTQRVRLSAEPPRSETLAARRARDRYEALSAMARETANASGRADPAHSEGAPYWPAYVRVAERRTNANRHAARILEQEGRALRPVSPAGRGRALAATFWGRAWCDNLAAYASLLNRLDRGRRYLRGGLVIDLQIGPGTVTSLVSGSEVYEISVRIAPIAPQRWKSVVRACAGKIDSVVELLAGRFDQSVMAHVSNQETGLFPEPAAITYQCTCPDGWTGRRLCKHVAATLYGVGVRLDEDPGLLFRLRGVDPADLLARAAAGLAAGAPAKAGGRRAIEPDRLTAVFGIELDTRAPAGVKRRPRGPRLPD